jgi:hypothetical protein
MRHPTPTRPTRATVALATAVALALPAARLAAQDPHDKSDKPVTVKQVAKNVGNESKRVYRRSEKAVSKGAKDTEKQTKRTGKQVARTVSPKERERQDAEKRNP